jgi:hypothetical protein
MGRIRNAQNIMEKYEKRRPLGTPKHRWEDNIKMYLWEIRCGLYLSGSG